MMQTGAFVFVLLMSLVFDAYAACASNQRLVCKYDWPKPPSTNANDTKNCPKNKLACCNLSPYAGGGAISFDTCVAAK
ncbi:uncharacterized protein PGTG_22469 [Puccinia graminis f. sp. tritici CRL 75-36-700-3]|uniref:Uncharacterized protein n=1 Tax=Puccinia graminis f. sp. tritici (strain CRL 75-36-700-3 / race SCCL) TaxID=418459 RepID=H6QUR9_PUCGT|nr:uncharacterized protein PGTG_22469 [Puccinia graminis f. sp. tritici CRL 75-36-700-3]EHS64827.1 hypothetical protein PGTG_22469 [Puccinia graminis f. sp. tritici CRL 75-36-700-3]